VHTMPYKTHTISMQWVKEVELHEFLECYETQEDYSGCLKYNNVLLVYVPNCCMRNHIALYLA